MYLMPGCEMTPRGFNARGFFPVNTKWAGSSAIGQQRKRVPLRAGPYYMRRRKMLGQEDVSYSPLPDTLTPPDVTDSTPPLILIPSNAGDVTSSQLPDTLTPPTFTPTQPASPSPLLNLQPAAAAAASAPSLLQTIFGTGTAARQVTAPGVIRPAAIAAPASIAGFSPVLLVGGGLLLLVAIGKRR